jgi:TonB family protein
MGILAGLPAIRACYREALRRAPSLAGTLKVAFEIAADGRPAGVAVQGPGLTDAALQRCALQKMSVLRFKPPRWARLGTKLQATYPLRFAPAEVDGERAPVAVTYREGGTPRVATGTSGIEITLPRGARALLAAAHPEHRLATVKDLTPDARGRLGLPLPFAVAEDFDRDGAEDLALVLIAKPPAAGWRLVVLHGAPRGTPADLRVAAESKTVLFHLRANPGPEARGLFLTRDGQCFCDRRCLSVASDRGRAVELEWAAGAYRLRVESYVPRSK